MSRGPFLLILLPAMALAVLFSAFNPQSVDLHLLLARLQAPLGVALVAAFAAGLLVGVLGRILWVARLRRECDRLRRQLQLSEASRDTSLADHAG